MTYAAKTGHLWSVGKPAVAVGPREKESQVTFLHAATPTHSSSFFVKGQVSELCAHGGIVWVVFEDGLFMSFNSKSGEKVWTITKFQSEAGISARVSLATTPALERLWASDGYAMYFYEGDGVFSTVDNHSIGAEVALVAQAAALPAAAGAGARQDVREEMVASVGKDGTVCLWNGTDKSCEAARLKGPKEPLLVVGSCWENAWAVVGGESVVVYVYSVNKLYPSK